MMSVKFVATLAVLGQVMFYTQYRSGRCNPIVLTSDAIFPFVCKVLGLENITPGGFVITAGAAQGIPNGFSTSPFLLPNGGNVPVTTQIDTTSNAANLQGYQYVVIGACVPYTYTTTNNGQTVTNYGR